MKLSNAVKPVSQLRAHAPEILRGLAEDRNPVVITENGEAVAVLQDVKSYEETQESLALLKILAIANRSVETGKTRPASEAFARVRRRLKG